MTCFDDLVARLSAMDTESHASFLAAHVDQIIGFINSGDTPNALECLLAMRDGFARHASIYDLLGRDAEIKKLYEYWDLRRQNHELRELLARHAPDSRTVEAVITQETEQALKIERFLADLVTIGIADLDPELVHAR